MLKLTAKNSYMYDSLHEISELRVKRKFVDCKLVFRGGVVQCHAAMLQYANIWWVNCRSSDIDECVIIIPDMSVVEGSDLVECIYSGTKLRAGVNDFNNNSADDDHVHPFKDPEDLLSSLTSLTAKLKDDALTEDDIVNILVELAQLEVTVPALLETGAGKVVNRLKKETEGRVSKVAGALVLMWKTLNRFPVYGS